MGGHYPRAGISGAPRAFVMVVATQRGSTRHLAQMTRTPVHSIPEVAALLGKVLDHALSTTTAGDRDGIVCFTSLYKTITETVDRTEYADRPFLERLDVEFARRYFDALSRYATDRASAPTPWRLLFDARSHPDIERVQFAAAGVNAHINYDLADALLATWEDFPPTAARRGDYQLIDGVFRDHMDNLREHFDAWFGRPEDDDGVGDRLSNLVCGLLVRGCRAEAWNDAERVWEHADRPGQRTRMLRSLDREAGVLGRALLLPFL
jgi:hypothetical protein